MIHFLSITTKIFHPIKSGGKKKVKKIVFLTTSFPIIGTYKIQNGNAYK